MVGEVADYPGGVMQCHMSHGVLHGVTWRGNAVLQGVMLCYMI